MAEELILKNAPVKKVVYYDLKSSVTYDVAPDATFNWTLPFPVKKPRYLLICPYLCSKNNGAFNPASTSLKNASDVVVTAILGSPINSPFSSAPNTVTPFVQFTNFNVKWNGNAIYQVPTNYSWQQFQLENRPSMSINGGQTVGMSSGLISEVDYNQNGYNFVYVDLSRHTLVSDKESGKIEIELYNSSLIPLDLYAFVGYEKSFEINVSTGVCTPAE